MSIWLFSPRFVVVAVLASIALFFFTLTRGALLMRGAMGSLNSDASHVYPIYSNMRLIRLVDFQPIIAAILLFQYDRLVSAITHGMQQQDLQGRKVLITSCAFGNVIPRAVKAGLDGGASKVQIADIILNELEHAERKLPGCEGRIELLHDNAIAMSLPDASVQANVVFFLLHELPHHLKGEVLREATRVLAPGGKLYLAEFHKPTSWVLRTLSWTYFKVFEPYGLALWDTHDPVKQIEAMGGFSCERHTVFFGNFQIVVATRDA